MKQKSLIKKFNKQAIQYSKRQESDGASRYRRRIFQDARGKVLEVGVGAGQNFPFFNSEVELTGVDFSPEMLKLAESAALNYSFSATFIQHDVETIEFPENRFDTILSSATLCAYQAPLTVLNRFQKWCKPDGQILLMEHGLSSSKPLAWLQKSLDPLALRFAGCHADRDISGLVNSSSLQLVREERYMAGNIYLIWAKP